jgi:hypothetical protein
MNDGTAENFVVKSLIDAGVDLSYIQQSATLRNKSQQERQMFQDMIETIQAQSDGEDHFIHAFREGTNVIIMPYYYS